MRFRWGQEFGTCFWNAFFRRRFGTCFCRPFCDTRSSYFPTRSSWDKIARVRRRLRELKGDMHVLFQPRSSTSESCYIRTSTISGARGVRGHRMAQGKRKKPYFTVSWYVFAQHEYVRAHMGRLVRNGQTVFHRQYPDHRSKKNVLIEKSNPGTSSPHKKRNYQTQSENLVRLHDISSQTT